MSARHSFSDIGSSIPYGCFPPAANVRTETLQQVAMGGSVQADGAAYPAAPVAQDRTLSGAPAGRIGRVCSFDCLGWYGLA